MSSIKSLFKWIGAFSLLTFILERTASSYGGKAFELLLTSQEVKTAFRHKHACRKYTQISCIRLIFPCEQALPGRFGGGLEKEDLPLFPPPTPYPWGTPSELSRYDLIRSCSLLCDGGDVRCYKNRKTT